MSLDVYILKFERENGELVADTLPFLGNSETSLTGVEFHYIGDARLIERVSRTSRLTEARPTKVKLNKDIARRYKEKTGDVEEPDDTFVGVPVTQPKDVLAGKYENKIIFKENTEELTGEYFLMSLRFNDTRYASFLLRLDAVKGGALLFVNNGLVAENGVLIYRSWEVFEKAVGTRHFSGTVQAKLFLKTASTVVQNDGTILMRNIGDSGFFVPLFFKDYRVKAPTNHRLTYSVRPYELVDIDKVRPVRAFRSTDVVNSTLTFYDVLSQPVSMTGRSFIGTVTGELYLNLADKLSPTENGGSWGFFTVSLKEYTFLSTMNPEAVVEVVAGKENVGAVENTPGDLEKAMLLFDNFIEEVRRMVCEYVRSLNARNTAGGGAP